MVPACSATLITKADSRESSHYEAAYGREGMTYYARNAPLPLPAPRS